MALVSRTQSFLTTFRNSSRVAAIFAVPLFGLLFLDTFYFLRDAHIALLFPFDLNYGEGIVWQQMRNIMAGHGYEPFGVYPAIVYHYPPIYHLTTALTASLFGIDQLLAGRLVSLTSTLVIALLVGLLSADLVGRREPLGTRFICGMIAGLVVLCCVPIVVWSSIMRVDMLCTALTLTGLLLLTRSENRPVLIVAAGVMFTLAIYTKQTAIAAPTAAFLTLLYFSPRRAILLLITCLTLGSMALIWLIWNTDGGFFEHIIRYNVNRLDLIRGKGVVRQLLYHLFFICTALVGLRMAFLQVARIKYNKSKMSSVTSEGIDLLTFMVVIYFTLCTLMLPMILKSGSDINYLIEWLCVVSILVGFGAKPIFSYVLDHGSKPSLVLFALYFIGLPFTIFTVSRVHEDTYGISARHQARDLEKIVALIRRSPKPVISDDMALLIRAGKPVTWEPAITAELGHAGIYDERKFAAMVRNRDFGFFITRSLRGTRPYDERYNPVIADAMDAAYPRKVIFAGEVLHLPR